MLSVSCIDLLIVLSQVALFLKEHRELVLESYKVGKVLDIIVERNMKSRETNDVQAIKCHYYATIIRLANKSLKNSEDTLDGFLKRSDIYSLFDFSSSFIHA